ncbi:hypothetical protein J5J86_20800 [Aquabacter sp. L1I39]|uniref:hypothetical protein n=1 Tax=Aquabacter sp. L1I39 TaxID=2820278 RepID=UPI001AD9C97D|nr:hypothetical protein [Aquabacter sp. L1I39]QTL03165.1 hypothetical protein J5J86_20800 [Aquabacter sp. L1I39]
MIDQIPPEWIAAITSSTVVSIAGVIVGAYYKAKVEKSIQHRYDAKIEEIRSGFRASEEALKADLRAKADQITALRSGALTGLANRYTSLDKRRLEAIDKIWTSVIRRSKLKFAVKVMGGINVDVALDLSRDNGPDGAAVREFAFSIWKLADIDGLNSSDIPDTERPFLPPMVWAMYSAYFHVISHALAQLAGMRTGVGKKILSDPAPTLALVKSALPHQSEFIDQHGVSGFTSLIDELEDSLLREIQNSLHNPDADFANLKQAASILAASENLSSYSQEIIVPPSVLAAAPRDMKST